MLCSLKTLLELGDFYMMPCALKTFPVKKATKLSNGFIIIYTVSQWYQRGEQLWSV